MIGSVEQESGGEMEVGEHEVKVGRVGKVELGGV